MNLRFFSTLALALVFAVSLAAATLGGENTKKAPAAKKEIKSCCSAESKSKSEKDCMDMKEVHSKDAEAKDARSSHKDNETKAEKKQDANGGEKK